jgi:hypothetical protein
MRTSHVRNALAGSPAWRYNSSTEIPSSGTNRMNCSHMVIETSQGSEVGSPVEPCFVVRCGTKCSNSLSNSIVKATKTCDNSADNGRRTLMAEIILKQQLWPESGTSSDSRRRRPSDIRSVFVFCSDAATISCELWRFGCFRLKVVFGAACSGAISCYRRLSDLLRKIAKERRFSR